MGVAMHATNTYSITYFWHNGVTHSFFSILVLFTLIIKVQDMAKKRVEITSDEDFARETRYLLETLNYLPSMQAKLPKYLYERVTGCVEHGRKTGWRVLHGERKG